ncbi:hypothetical protein GCM10025884_18020 [Leuconostoc gelidum subsp. gelidum]|nr:hypothetical protein GCM10025884_18020 [Leuconostoc gelidum subsp. gelidum]
MVGQSYNYKYEKQRVFFMIDSKSFYASVESVELGLNPLRSILVVMSEQANTNGGLVLAASPMAKKSLEQVTSCANVIYLEIKN